MSRRVVPVPEPIDEAAYAAKARAELETWLTKMGKGPSGIDRAAKGVQRRINAIIPEKVHLAVTAVMEQMTRAIVTGADWTTQHPLKDATLSQREAAVRNTITGYRATAAAEGGVAGAGGFVLSLAEFPTLIATKIKLLFDIAALYGHDGADLSERLYILSIFQLAFSGAEHRRVILEQMQDWRAKAARRPGNVDDVDWRKFQQEYRDYIDLAKMAQLIPVIGAPVGAVVNYRLVDRLGEAAMGAYRLRWFAGVA